MYLSKIAISLHSKDADLLFNGGDKTKQFIPGFHFAHRRINALYAMGMKGNPYAETALIELDMRLEQVDIIIDDAIRKSVLVLKEAEQDGMVLTLLSMDKPMCYEIDYATEYGNLLAKMMVRVDSAFRHVRTAYSSGYLDAALAKVFIKSLRRNVRMVFDRTSSYAKKIQPGITRDDLKQKTDKGKAMIEKMGMPNEKILSGELTFKYKRINELD